MHTSPSERMFTCFFISSRRRHTRFDCDWSSDVCSSDLALSYNNPSEQATQSVFAGRAAATAAPVGGNDLMQDRAPAPARVGGDDVIKTVKREEPKIGRNDPCWCGSGKKFKKCHGA